MTKPGGLIFFAIMFLITSSASAGSSDPVRAAHENLEADARTDDLGITVPRAPVSHPGRRYPATGEFPSGPEIGERLPEFSLANQSGEMVDYHGDRGNSSSIVVFYRSAVW